MGNNDNEMVKPEVYYVEKEQAYVMGQPKAGEVEEYQYPVP